MQSASARRRRAQFNRSLTLPSDYIHEESTEEAEEQSSEQSQLLGNQPCITEDSNETSMESENESSDNQSPLRKPLVSQTKRAKLQRSVTMAAGDHRPLLEKHSTMDVKTTTDVSKSPLMSSTLLSKVKERIKQKVMQSTEWPNAAAIVQERRQRALDALEATFNSGNYRGVDIIPLKDMTNKESTKRRSRVRSEPVPAQYSTQVSTNSNTSSVSDTPSTSSGQQKPIKARRSVSETYATSASASFNGIICSNEDLKSILQDFKVQRKPLPPKPYKRTQSLDCGRMQTLISQSQISHESTSSGTSLLSESIEEQVDNNQTIVNMDFNEDDEKEDQDLSDKPKSKTKPRHLTLTLREYSHLTSVDEGADGNSSEDGGGSPSQAQPAEIRFDEHGQTWDIYGAEFDPEILGFAIQKHLDRMMSPETITEEVDENGNGGDTNKSSEESPEALHEDTSFWDKLLCLFRRRRSTNTSS